MAESAAAVAGGTEEADSSHKSRTGNVADRSSFGFIKNEAHRPPSIGTCHGLANRSKVWSWGR
jgi:hypothetical protein